MLPRGSSSVLPPSVSCLRSAAAAVASHPMHVTFYLLVKGFFHDKYGEVKYTDIDYTVVTDASRYDLSVHFRFQFVYKCLHGASTGAFVTDLHLTKSRNTGILHYSLLSLQ